MIVVAVWSNASVKMNGAKNSRDGDTSNNNTSFGAWSCTNCVIVVNVDGFKPAPGLMCPGPAYMDLIVECNAINHTPRCLTNIIAAKPGCIITWWRLFGSWK